MDAKTIGWINIIGGALALVFARELFKSWSGTPLAVGILALVFLITGYHHLTEKKH